MFSSLVSPLEAYNFSLVEECVFLDCRFALGDTELGRTQYTASHIPSAYYLHLDEDLSGPVVPGQTGRHPLPSVDHLAALLGDIGVDNQTQVFCYDDSGSPFAARAWWLLRYLGHDGVAVVDGGWTAWVNAKLPVSSEQPQRSATTYEPRLRHHMLAGLSDVLGAVETKSAVLVDARARARYLGEEEPIDPVAGHIPGALSCPFKENLNADGSFKDRDHLIRMFASVSTGRPVISYCGSGVTGAHNALAMFYAGLPEPALYVGSWSEWITDSSRAIEVG